MVKAKEKENTYWYFSDGGGVRMITYSGKLFWVTFFVVFVLFWLFVGIGGAIGGAITGGIVSIAFEAVVSSPKVKRWDSMPLKQLEGEEKSKTLPWSSMKKVTFNAPERLEVTVDERVHKMKVLTDVEVTQKLLKDHLGSRFSEI
ncbi:hypothetical protein [Cuniculiplasma divulgatum]|uniref:hypothetical protein n=1 Tax=Cuniculiplasma divulgatum TaxID=1673428 RepID=UPI0011E5D2F9|nr:hypothetical protein [Cuniculiplasma divulgatum]